jgi:hypothetical protein
VAWLRTHHRLCLLHPVLSLDEHPPGPDGWFDYSRILHLPRLFVPCLRRPGRWFQTFCCLLMDLMFGCIVLYLWMLNWLMLVICFYETDHDSGSFSRYLYPLSHSTTGSLFHAQHISRACNDVFSNTSRSLKILSVAIEQTGDFLWAGHGVQDGKL